MARRRARRGRSTRASSSRAPAWKQEPPRDFGVIDLVEEFTALRHEVKLQTKSGRGLIEQTETTVSALRQAIEQFRSVEPKEAQAVWAAGKALAEALADLDEALDRGRREIDRARRPDRRRIHPRPGGRLERPSSPPILDPPPAASRLSRARSSTSSDATAWRAMTCSTRSSKDTA